MPPLAELYLDNAGTLFLAAFAAASLVLVAVARHRLSPWWWAGAMASGLIVVGISTMVALALQGLDSGQRDGIPPAGLWAIGVAGLLGFVAGADVQLALGAIRRRRGGIGTVVAGAVLGPVIIVGGYLLLVRSMEWVRFGLG